MIISIDNYTLVEYNLQFFAKEGPGGEKTEEPTSKKLDDARKKGQVAKSHELNMAVELMAFFVILKIYLSTMGSLFENFFEKIYSQIPDTIVMYDGQIPLAAIKSNISAMLLQIVIMCLPFFLSGIIISFACSILQVGFKVTTEPLKPTLNKLNPASGIKKIVSAQSLFELVKSIAKIVLIAIVLFYYLKSRSESLFLLYDMSLEAAIDLLFDIIINLGLRIAAVYMIIAVSDFVFQKRKFHKDMMMTKQEIKDEYKEAEGDPQVKGKQKQRMREASQRRMMQDIKKADVVITNPTHYAVAVLYEQDKNTAPIVVGKGSDYLAKKIKEVARDNDIEIVENKPLARMLYANVDIGQMIPPELYKAVAEVLAFVYHLKGKA